MNINYDKNKEIIDRLKDKYGLVPAKMISRDDEEGFLRLRLKNFPEVLVFPHSQIHQVVEILARDDNLWNQSALNVFALPPITWRAPIFGVPLKRAFKEALKKGLVKSRFALHPREGEELKGYRADLLIFVMVSEIGKNTREVEIWENTQGISEVFYGHMILDAEEELVGHFDCATINIPEEHKKILFENATKIKGISKEKHFRIDGELPLSIALDLMRAYFPVEELIEEACEMQKYKIEARVVDNG